MRAALASAILSEPVLAALEDARAPEARPGERVLAHALEDALTALLGRHAPPPAGEPD